MEYKNRQILIWCHKYRNQICMAAAIILAVLITGAVAGRGSRNVNAKVSKVQEELAKEVFRFHVLANSDTKEDQALKMKVKEGVIAYMKQELPNAKSAEETKAWAAAHEKEIEETAAGIIQREGYGYAVSAKVTSCYFPDKTYGDVTFPAGEYEALRIEIGKAGGHNWWCVLYPNLCFVDSTHAVVPKESKEELKEVLTDDEYEMITATTTFKIKWFFFGNEED